MDARVGITAMNSYYFAFKPEASGMWGGAEVQVMLLAQEFKRRGIDVVLITSADRSARVINRKDDLTFVSLCYPKSSITHANPVTFVSSLSLPIIPLWHALDLADCDIYFQRIAEWTTFGVALYSHLNNRKFVFSIAHDDDCKLHTLQRSSFDKILIKFGIKKADVVVAQSYRQRTMLKKNFGIDAEVVPSATILPNDFSPGDGDIILWVGRMVSWKRPHLFLHMAENLPDYRFVMIGGRDMHEPQLFDDIKSMARDIKNLVFLGHQPYSITMEHFNHAAIYVNTSIEEGFPNTFLHAFRIGRPVISIDVDPDGILCKNGIGVHAKGFDTAVSYIKELMDNPKERRAMGLRARRYCEQHHDIIHVGDRYISIFESLLRR